MRGWMPCNGSILERVRDIMDKKMLSRLFPEGATGRMRITRSAEFKSVRGNSRVGGLTGIEAEDPESGKFVPVPTRSILYRDAGIHQEAGIFTVDTGEITEEQWRLERHQKYPDTCIPEGCREHGFNYLPRGVNRVYKEDGGIAFECNKPVSVRIQSDVSDVFNDWLVPNVIGYKKNRPTQKKHLLSNYFKQTGEKNLGGSSQIRFNIIQPDLLEQPIQSLQSLTGRSLSIVIKKNIPKWIPIFMKSRLEPYFEFRYDAVMRFAAVQCNANSFQENCGVDWMSFTLDIVAGNGWNKFWTCIISMLFGIIDRVLSSEFTEPIREFFNRSLTGNIKGVYTANLIQDI